MFSSSALKDLTITSLLGFGLFVAGVLLPALALPFMFLYSFPTLLLSYERGIRLALLSAFLVAFALFALLSPLLPLVYFQTFGLLGVFLGFAVKRVKNVPDLILLGIFVSLLCKIATTVAIFRATGINLFAPDTAEMEKAFLSLAGSKLAIVSEGLFPSLEGDLRRTLDYMVLLIPYSVIFFSVVEVVLSLLLSSYVHKRRTGQPFFALPPFSAWSFPRNVLFALVAGLVLDLLAQKSPDSQLLKQISVNLVAVTRSVFIVQGLSVGYFFMESRGFPKMAKIAVVMITPLISAMSDLFSILGVLDIGFDLRKRMRRG